MNSFNYRIISFINYSLSGDNEPSSLNSSLTLHLLFPLLSPLLATSSQRFVTREISSRRGIDKMRMLINARETRQEKLRLLFIRIGLLDWVKFIVVEREKIRRKEWVSSHDKAVSDSLRGESFSCC